MTKYRTEYRINKKGCECYRTDSFQQAKEKLDELSAKRPGIFTMQSRHVQLDRFGVAIRDVSGIILWESWS